MPRTRSTVVNKRLTALLAASVEIKGVTVMKYENQVVELEAQQTEIAKQLTYAKTMRERERVLALRAEIRADHERLKELRSESDRVAAKNKPLIAEKEAEIKKLREESFDVWMNAEELERAIGIKNREIMSLERQISSVK